MMYSNSLKCCLTLIMTTGLIMMSHGPAAAFEDARGYRPPYWDLRELARQALEATR